MCCDPEIRNKTAAKIEENKLLSFITEVESIFCFHPLLPKKYLFPDRSSLPQHLRDTAHYNKKNIREALCIRLEKLSSSSIEKLPKELQDWWEENKKKYELRKIKEKEDREKAFEKIVDKLTLYEMQLLKIDQRLIFQKTLMRGK